MNNNEKLNLIKRNLLEVVTEEELKKLLEEKEMPVVYIGTSITGRPHVGYFAWAVKLADFLNAGLKVKLLLADIHGALDNCPWELLEKRYIYYSFVIPKMIENAGAKVELGKNFEIIKGSEFQLEKNYFLDLLKLSSFVSINNAKKAASDVVKFGENPKLSGLIYPLMQTLDEQYLGVDIQYGGVDQRKIMMLARESLDKVNYKPRIELMTPLIPGLSAGGKMSSSDINSKIDLLDDEKTIIKKLNKAYCPEGEVNENGVLAFVKYVIFSIKEYKKEDFVIKRPEKFGGNLIYKNYSDLEKDFKEKKLHPMDLKNAVAIEINELTKSIRELMSDKEKIVKEAYP